MAYCGPLGLPYAQFTEWDDLSRAAALAWQRRESQRCRSCGEVATDWAERDDDGQPIHTKEGHPKWVTPLVKHAVPVWCPGCHTLDQGRKAQGPDPDPAVHMHLRASHPTSG